MALTTTDDLKLAINRILLAQFKNRGTRFPLDEIVRDGGMSNADALTVRGWFDTYYLTTLARPSLTPAHEDKLASIHTTEQHGRSGRGGGDINADKAAVIDKTTQTGRR